MILNAFRSPNDRRYNEERLQQLSPSAKHVTRDAYRLGLGIPEPKAFEKLVDSYIKNKNEDLLEQVKESFTLTPDQEKPYNAILKLQAALKEELQLFTDAVTKLPANTHADVLQNIAQEEQRIILAKIKVLNKITAEFTEGLIPKATTGTAAGAGTETATDTTGSATKPTLSASETRDLAEKFGVSGDKSDTPKDPALEKLEQDLTDNITDMHRAAQLQRDRIPLLAALTANKRKHRRMINTFQAMSDSAAELFGRKKDSPDGAGVNMMGSKQDQEINKLCKAMQKLDLAGSTQKKLGEAKENLKKAEARLKKAEEKDDQENIEKYNKEIEEYKKQIAALDQDIATRAQKASAEMQGTGYLWELLGYDPALTALSGRKITPIANAQGLGFSMNFPAPMFDPLYYTSSEHNTKADLVCMVELIKVSGAKEIEVNITSGFFKNPKRALRLAQEAWEAALEVGFDEKDITIMIDGSPRTKEQLYQDLDRQSGKETGKYKAKEQRAESFKQTAHAARSQAATSAPHEMARQEHIFRKILQAGRDKLDALAPDLPTPPAEDSAVPTVPTAGGA